MACIPKPIGCKSSPSPALMISPPIFTPSILKEPPTFAPKPPVSVILFNDGYTYSTVPKLRPAPVPYPEPLHKRNHFETAPVDET